MKYLLDTDTLIYFLNGVPELSERILAKDIDQLFTSIINYSELYYGAYNSKKVSANTDKLKELFLAITILPFDEPASLIYAKQKAKLKKQGKLIADLDLMIASIALHNQYILVSNNVKHFARIDNLQVESWL